MIKLKKILVPTDFSDTSQKAFQYAGMIAEKYGDILITVLHTYIIPSTIEGYTGVPLMMDAELTLEHEKMLKNKMEEFIGQASLSGSGAANNTRVNYVIEMGMAVDEIIRMSKEDVDLVVLGATGEYGIIDKFFGSISAAVSRNAACPVLVIPKDSPVKPLKNILYTGNYLSANPKTVSELIDIAKHFSAKLHVVHVETKSQSTPTVDESYFKKLFETEAPDLKVNISSVVDEDSVWSGLERYVSDHSIDLLVVVTKHRSFWDNILHKSVTKEIVMHSHLPVMIYHYEDRV